MPRIPPTGPVAISEINTEFGLGNALSAYRGSYHDEWPCKFPAGTIGYSDFRGKAKVAVPSPIASSIRQDPNRIFQFTFGGGQLPAPDSITNYVIVYPTGTGSNYTVLVPANGANPLQVGRKYSYALFTSADEYGFRNLANGTQIRSWGYNGFYPAAEDKVTYQNWKDNGTPYNPPYTNGGLASIGTFTYNPQTIVAGDGTSRVGHLIARNTYGVSDAGKGAGTLTVFEVCYMFRLCETYGIPFVDNNL